MADEIYLGDVGVNLKYTITGLTALQLAAITVKQYEITTASGVKKTVVPSIADAVLSYSTVVGDLVGCKGIFRIVPYIETSFGLKKHLDEATFYVKDPNDL
jgi:hypothetical protein